ncbi:MAG TPA: cyclophane-containing peptide 2OG-Fe(II) oxygenase YhhC [Pyrinomonadaceae bacterium]|jgi:Rps23 Pro-64 3,4-dihydroxylase Tpa1-like proline 4-hydroxylase|nr:cyclophane-containing peptide 2OG-Fe(II) oxygenase YhhC [Pyrinomonadaceae bacterium]
MIATPDKAQDFSSIEFFSVPFPYFFSPAALTEETSLLVLEWLENCTSWKLKETDFYEQHEFSFWDVELPARLSFLKGVDFLNTLKKGVEELFGVRLQKRLDFTAHKLVQGQRIRLHNDYIPGCESHRLLVQLNRGWTDENGGMLMFFNSSDPTDIHKIFYPLHNSAVGFAISADSNHAVSTIYGGERFTLVYSFYAEEEHV